MLHGEKVVLRPFQREDMKRVHELFAHGNLILLGGGSWEPVPLFLNTLASSARAVRCYAACGFQEEGRMRQHDFINGKYEDVLAMGLLREEWATRRGR